MSPGSRTSLVAPPVVPMRSRPPFFAIAHALLNTEDAAVVDSPSAMAVAMKSRRPIFPEPMDVRSRLILSTASRSEIPVSGSLVLCSFDFIDMNGSPRAGSKEIA